MVRILSINTSNKYTHHTDKLEEEVIEHSFSSNEELIDTILKQPDVFSAMRLVNEINSLNGYDVVSKYETKKIKEYYSTDFVSSHHEYIMIKEENNSVSETIFCKSKLNEARFFPISCKSNLKNDKVYSDNSQIKLKSRQSLFYELEDFSVKKPCIEKKMFNLSYQKLLSASSFFNEVFNHE